MPPVSRAHQKTLAEDVERVGINSDDISNEQAQG